MTSTRSSSSLQALVVMVLLFGSGVTHGQSEVSISPAGDDLVPIGGELSGGTVTIYSQGVRFSLEMIEAENLRNFHLYTEELNTSFPLNQVCHIDRRHLFMGGFLIDSPPLVEICTSPFLDGGVCPGFILEFANASAVDVRQIWRDVTSRQFDLPVSALSFEACIEL